MLASRQFLGLRYRSSYRRAYRVFSKTADLRIEHVTQSDC